MRGQDEDGCTETSLPRCIRFLRASDDSRLFTGARGHLAAIRVKEEAQRAEEKVKREIKIKKEEQRVV